MATEAELKARLEDPNLDPATELELRRALREARGGAASTDTVRAKYEGVDTGMPGGGDLPPEGNEPTQMAKLGYSMSQMLRGGLEFPQIVGAPALPGARGLREDEEQYRDVGGIGPSVVDRSPELLESLGPAASFLAFRNPGSGIATRAASAMGTNAGLGALSPADTPEEQVSNAKMGAMVGGAFQLLPELYAGSKNIVWNRERAATKTNTYKEGQRLEERTGIPLSEGARSLDSSTLKLEAEALGEAKEVFRQEEIPASLRYFKRITDKMDPADVPDNVLLGQMDEAFTSHVENLATSRRMEWAEDAAKIRAVAGNKPLFYPDKLAGELQNLSEEIIKVSPKISKEEAGAFASDLEKIMNQGGVTIDDVDRLLQNLTADSASTGFALRNLEPKMARLFANNLKTAFKEDIEAAIKADPKNKALVMLNEARDTYAKNSKPINELEGTALEKLFGKDGHKTPETVLDRLSKLPPSELRIVTRVMNKIDPDIMEKARGKFINQAVDHAYNAKRAANDPTYRLTELAGTLEKNPKQFNAMFPDPTVRAEIKDGIEAIRRLAASSEQRAAQSAATSTRQVGLSAAYLDPPSAAVRIASVFTPAVLSRMFFTPEGRKVISQLSVPNPSWQQRAAAGAALLRIAQED